MFIIEMHYMAFKNHENKFLVCKTDQKTEVCQILATSAELNIVSNDTVFNVPV